MAGPLEGLEPAELWARFDEIRQIPRPSKHEARICAHIAAFARTHGCSVREDATGNLVISVPATAGREGAPTVVLQAHVDMVCEKNSDVAFDFHADPIQLRRDGDWLLAQGTTLGADNGIGVAAALRFITDSSTPHGPLELLLTVDEETGLTGAKGLDGSLITGTLLINLDSEEDGEITIGCAGGGDVSYVRPLTRVAAAGSRVRIAVTGGRGGHSGIEIHEGRANAVKVLVGAIACLDGVPIVSIDGGNAHNAIPREATGVVVGDVEAVRAGIAAGIEAARERFRDADPDLAVEVSSIEDDRAPWSDDDARALMSLLKALPHGELARDPNLPDLVETSANLATVSTEDDSLKLLSSCRSSSPSSLAALIARHEALGRDHGATTHTGDAYPPWAPDPESALLATAIGCYERRYGTRPHVAAIHAGLECGLIGERVPEMDMISIGPTIVRPHSPTEAVSVSSVEKMMGDYLPDILAALSE